MPIFLKEKNNAYKGIKNACQTVKIKKNDCFLGLKHTVIKEIDFLKNLYFKIPKNY